MTFPTTFVMKLGNPRKYFNPNTRQMDYSHRYQSRCEASWNILKLIIQSLASISHEEWSKGLKGVWWILDNSAPICSASNSHRHTPMYTVAHRIINYQCFPINFVSWASCLMDSFYHSTVWPCTIHSDSVVNTAVCIKPEM